MFICFLGLYLLFSLFPCNFLSLVDLFLFPVFDVAFFISLYLSFLLLCCSFIRSSSYFFFFLKKKKTPKTIVLQNRDDGVGQISILIVDGLLVIFEFV